MKFKIPICLLLSLSLMLFVACDKVEDTDNGDNSSNESSGGGNENSDENNGGENSGNEGGSSDDNGSTDDNENSIPPIDYIGADMKDYIILSPDVYKNFTLSVNISKPKRILAKVEILNLLSSYRTVVGEGKAVNDLVIGPGDVASIYYRGYIIDPNTKEQISVSGMSNFDYLAHDLIIGSGGFIPGFEYNMLGMNIADYAKFDRITTGNVTKDHVVYLNFTRTSGSETVNGSYERIDLANADKIYGDGFSEYLIGKEIGKAIDDFTVTVDGKEYKYSDVTVKFVTLCEKESTNGGLPIKVVECYFPYNYGHELLQNKTAYFEVYVDYAIDYETPELNDEFIMEFLESSKIMSKDELTAYEGSTAVEKLESYVYEILQENYENDKQSLVEKAIWELLLEAAQIIKYPEGNLNEAYRNELEKITSNYEKYGGLIYGNSGLVRCESLDEYACIALGISNGADWRSTLLEMCKILIKERLIIYYILQAEELMPDKETLENEITVLKQKELDNALEEYFKHSEYNKDDLTEAQLAEIIQGLSTQLEASYNDEYFIENICNDIFMKMLLDNATIEDVGENSNGNQNTPEDEGANGNEGETGADEDALAFDYVTSDLSKYIYISEDDYKNYELELSIAKPHSIDIDVAILRLISAERFRYQIGDGKAFTDIAVTAGDKVKVRYRGYTLDDAGNQVIVSSLMSNIIYAEGTDVQIGEFYYQLPVGFELGLIGKNPNDYAKFEKITSGKAIDHEHGDDWVVYITAEKVPTASIGTDNEQADTIKLNCVRIDLSEVEEVNKYFGKGFVDVIKSYEIGVPYSSKFIINNEEYTYKFLTINFATTCEKAETSANGKSPLTVEGYFAYDFGIDGTATADLRNKTVYYDVFIEEIIPYDTPIASPDELTEDFVLEFVNEAGDSFTEEELRTYEGSSLVEKFRNYVKKHLDDAYEEALDIMIEDAMWDRYHEKADVIKYPTENVGKIYQEYLDDVQYQYDYSGGSLHDENGNLVSYDTVDAFAAAYLGLSEGDDWKARLYTIAEDLVKERLIYFYIMQKEDIIPTEDELNAKAESIKAEYLDDYIEQYIDYKEYNDSSFDKSTLVGEAYDAFVEERKKELFDYYDNEYFEEIAYYEIGLQFFLTYPTVYTLDSTKP